MKIRKFNYKRDFKRLIPWQKENIKINLPWQDFKIKFFKEACINAEKNDDVFLFFEKNDLIGWLWLTNPKQNQGYISHIQVSSKKRGKGYGKKIMGFAISYLKKKNKKVILLKVTKTNNVAINLYKKLKFKVIGQDHKRLLMRKRMK